MGAGLGTSDRYHLNTYITPAEHSAQRRIRRILVRRRGRDEGLVPTGYELTNS